MKNMFYIPRLETLEERNLLDAGSLDPSFGVGGIAIPGFDLAREVHQEALEPDGKIVVVGSYSPVPQRNFAVARYNSDGSPDTSFGQGGFVLVTDLVGMGYGVAIQNDGKIVALASTVQGFVMARLNTDGSMDSSFGTGGIVKTKIDPTFLGTRVVFQPDGRIMVVGETTIFPDTHVGYPGYALARYKVDGSLDKSFGVDGIATYSFFNWDGYVTIRNLALQADGKILVEGNAFNVEPGKPDNVGTTEVLLFRLNLDGTLDTHFGTGGLVETDLGGLMSTAAGLAVQQDGKIIVLGYSAGPEIPNTYYPSQWPDLPTGSFGLARFNPDGSLDETFGADGKVVEHIEVIDSPFDVALQENGKILVFGSAYAYGNSREDLELLRFNPTGDLDPSFAKNGIASLRLQSLPLDFTNGGVVIQPDGNIVVMANTYGYFDGSSQVPEQSRIHQTFVLARFLGGDNPIPDKGGDSPIPNEGSSGAGSGSPHGATSISPGSFLKPPIGQASGAGSLGSPTKKLFQRDQVVVHAANPSIIGRIVQHRATAQINLSSETSFMLQQTSPERVPFSPAPESKYPLDKYGASHSETDSPHNTLPETGGDGRLKPMDVVVTSSTTGKDDNNPLEGIQASSLWDLPFPDWKSVAFSDT